MAPGEFRGGNPAESDARESGAADHCDPRLWGPRLQRILDRQHDLFGRLNELSLAQRLLIEQEDTDGLLDLLARRQSIIEQIDRTNEEVAPFSDAWERLSAQLPEATRLSLRERFEAVAALVSAIATRDEHDRALLSRRRDSIGDDLQNMGRSRGAMAAYARTADPVDPVFKDERG